MRSQICTTVNTGSRRNSVHMPRELHRAQRPVLVESVRVPVRKSTNRRAKGDCSILTEWSWQLVLQLGPDRAGALAFERNPRTFEDDPLRKFRMVMFHLKIMVPRQSRSILETSRRSRGATWWQCWAPHSGWKSNEFHAKYPVHYPRLCPYRAHSTYATRWTAKRPSSQVFHGTGVPPNAW